MKILQFPLSAFCLLCAPALFAQSKKSVEPPPPPPVPTLAIQAPPLPPPPPVLKISEVSAPPPPSPPLPCPPANDDIDKDA